MSHHRLRVIGLAAGLLVATCGGEEPRSERTPAPSVEAVEANNAVLSDVAEYPGASLLGRNDIEPPEGGRGATSYLYFAAEGDRTSIIEHFKGQLAGWELVKTDTVATRTTSAFVKGSRWLSVTASDVAGPKDAAPRPGYVLVVNALDAEVLRAQ